MDIRIPAAWTSLGAWIAAHMPFIVPLCVVAGVALPQVWLPFDGAVPFLFAVMTFQGSLSNTVSEVMEVFRRPAKLLAILGVTLVFMPVLAWAIANALFAGDVDLITGIVLEYSVPIGVVSFMWVGMFDGNGSLALAAILISTVISPFTIPVTLQLLLGQTVQMDAVGMMVNMIFMIALPALAGMLLNDATHGWGRATLSPLMSPACRFLLTFIITCNSSLMSDYVLHMTLERWCTALFILIFASSGFVWGIVAARVMRLPLPDTRGLDAL